MKVEECLGCDIPTCVGLGADPLELKCDSSRTMNNSMMWISRDWVWQSNMRQKLLSLLIRNFCSRSYHFHSLLATYITCAWFVYYFVSLTLAILCFVTLKCDRRTNSHTYRILIVECCSLIYVYDFTTMKNKYIIFLSQFSPQTFSQNSHSSHRHFVVSTGLPV